MSSDESQTPTSGTRRIAKMVGTAVLGVGLAVLAYGAVAFWLIQALPPNSVGSRLPSLYVMAAGIVVSLAGLVLRGFDRNDNRATDAPKKGIPTSLGILVLLAIIIAAIVAISQM